MKYYWGSDTYAARAAITELAEKEKATITWLDREDLDQDHAALSSQTSSLFGASLTVLRDPSNLPKSLQEKVVEACSSDQNNFVLWDRVKPDKRSKLWKALKESSEEFKEDGFNDLVVWLKQQAQDLEINIEDDATGELIKRLGNDKWRLSSELSRLGLVAPAITKELVEQEVVAKESAEIFAALDDLLAKNKKGAIEKIEILLQQGESEFYILTMLAYQFRTLLKLKRGETAGISPYVISKGKQVAARFSDASLVAIITKIMATDVAIKQGKVDARTGLLMLVLALAN